MGSVGYGHFLFLFGAVHLGSRGNACKFKGPIVRARGQAIRPGRKFVLGRAKGRLLWRFLVKNLYE
jgi:hypothetical protein